MTSNIFHLLTENVNDPTLEWLDQLYREATDIQTSRGLPDEAKFDYIKMQLNSPTAAQGSSRMVMKFNDQYVIKVATNAAGFAQNGIEATVGSDPAVEDLVAPVVGWSDVTDYDGFFWILSGKATPLSDRSVGKDWAAFAQYLKKAAMTDDPISPVYSGDTKVDLPPAAADKRKKEIEPLRAARAKEPSEIYRYVSPQFFDTFRQFLKRYGGSRTADLFKPDSWGITNNQLKLIDYGYTKRISDDYYVSGYFAGSQQARGKSLDRAVQRSKNVGDTLAGNIDTVSNVKSPPKYASLLLLLKGIILGLPEKIENFNLGDSLKPLTPTEKAGAAMAIRNNEKRVDSIIRQVSDSALRTKIEGELEDLMLSQGSLNANETFVRRLGG
jgi:hypothetical protein